MQRAGCGVSEETPGRKLLLNVPLTVTVEVGRRTMRLREVLELGAGSVLALDRAATDPVDLLVNGKCVARGEIVAVDDCFAIRIAELQA